jgi:hypothetical protein
MAGLDRFEVGPTRAGAFADGRRRPIDERAEKRPDYTTLHDAKPPAAIRGRPRAML